MLHLTLNRIQDTGNETIGELRVEGKPELLFHTIERPWLNNKARVSCIPKGTYKFVPHDGTAFKNVWRLEDVPDRSAILMHIGNTVKDVIGCIAVGLSTGKISGDPACLQSKQAIELMREFMGGQSGTITIL